MKQEQIPFKSSCRSTNKIIPSNFSRSTSSKYTSLISSQFSNNTNSLVHAGFNSDTNNSSAQTHVKKARFTLSAFLRSFLHVFSFSTSSFGSMVLTCRWLTIPSRALSLASPTPLGRKVIGTLFGHRKGHVSFIVQDDSKADPALLVELPMSTSALVREMSSGLVRIVLECERVSNENVRGSSKHGTKLFLEPVWTMYCNGRNCGYGISRACTEFDWYVLSMIQSTSVGAGVIPFVEDRTRSGSKGELLYMRAKFERVVGSRDSDAFYMLNPDGNAGPELSIFLIRL